MLYHFFFGYKMSWNVRAFLFPLFNKRASRSNKYSNTDRFCDLKWLQDWELSWLPRVWIHCSLRVQKCRDESEICNLQRIPFWIINSLKESWGIQLTWLDCNSLRHIPFFNPWTVENFVQSKWELTRCCFLSYLSLKCNTNPKKSVKVKGSVSELLHP